MERLHSLIPSISKSKPKAKPKRHKLNDSRIKKNKRAIISDGDGEKCWSETKRGYCQHV